jgi:hypothetical protein
MLFISFLLLLLVMFPQDFLKDLYSMLNSCGVAVAAKAPPVVYSTGREGVTQVLEQAVAAAKQAYGGKQPQLILVLLAFKVQWTM